LRLNGQEVRTADEARKFIQDQGVNPLRLTLVRNKVTQEVDVTPTYLTDIGRTGIGVGLADVGTVSLPPLSAVRAGAVMTGQLTKAIVIGFGDIIRGLITHRSVPAGVSGPVGIAVMAKDVAAQGVMPFLQFLGLLSVNLAVLNFLPIPALDGGRALFLMVEAIRRKPLNRAWEAGMHNVAFLILLMLIALITVRDLGHYSGTVSRLLQSI
jgi:regulator of sigma E protease